jgi:hypothetical protein
MKRRLLALAVLMTALSLSLSRPAAARPSQCFEENYGGGNCATTCVYYNDQGSVNGWTTTIHGC